MIKILQHVNLDDDDASKAGNSQTPAIQMSNEGKGNEKN